MLDGILDLLSAILVLGIVVAVAFGFILPLTSEDVMQYSETFDDKAMVGNVIEYDNSEQFDSITRRKYSYSELVLLLAVQDTRMGEPKAINMRDLVEKSVGGKPIYDDACVDVNLNDLTPFGNDDKVLETLCNFAENGRNFDFAESEFGEGDNVGTIKINEQYSLDFIEKLSTKLSTSGKYNIGSATGNYEDDRKYYISYHFAIPNDSDYIKNKSIDKFKFNYDEEPIFMVHIDDGNIDTKDYYDNRIDYIKENIK